MNGIYYYFWVDRMRWLFSICLPACLIGQVSPVFINAYHEFSSSSRLSGHPVTVIHSTVAFGSEGRGRNGETKGGEEGEGIQVSNKWGNRRSRSDHTDCPPPTPRPRPRPRRPTDRPSPTVPDRIRFHFSHPGIISQGIDNPVSWNGIWNNGIIIIYLFVFILLF